MGQDPEAIRVEIEETRERMGGTLDALEHKTDVKGRVKERLGMSSGENPARQAVSVAQENPLGLAVGGVAVGFLAGMLIPESTKEHEKLGPVADQVKEQAKQTGQEALDRGKQVAQSAAETAREEAKEHGSALADSAKESADEIRS